MQLTSFTIQVSNDQIQSVKNACAGKFNVEVISTIDQKRAVGVNAFAKNTVQITTKSGKNFSAEQIFWLGFQFAQFVNAEIESETN